MHIVAAALDQKPVESKQSVHDLSTICRIVWLFRRPDDACGTSKKEQEASTKC